MKSSPTSLQLPLHVRIVTSTQAPAPLDDIFSHHLAAAMPSAVRTEDGTSQVPVASLASAPAPEQPAPQPGPAPVALAHNLDGLDGAFARHRNAATLSAAATHTVSPQTPAGVTQTVNPPHTELATGTTAPTLPTTSGMVAHSNPVKAEPASASASPVAPAERPAPATAQPAVATPDVRAANAAHTPALDEQQGRAAEAPNPARRHPAPAHVAPQPSLEPIESRVAPAHPQTVTVMQTDAHALGTTTPAQAAKTTATVTTLPLAPVPHAASQMAPALRVQSSVATPSTPRQRAIQGAEARRKPGVRQRDGAPQAGEVSAPLSEAGTQAEVVRSALGPQPFQAPTAPQTEPQTATPPTAPRADTAAHAEQRLQLEMTQTAPGSTPGVQQPFRVDHPELGRIDMQLRLRADVLHLQAFAESFRAATALRAGQHSLRARLAQQGAALGELRVNLRGRRRLVEAGVDAIEASDHEGEEA